MSKSMDGTLTTGAQRLAGAAREKRLDHKHTDMGLSHWLLALVEKHAAMVEAMTPEFNKLEVRRELEKKLEQGEIGAPAADETIIPQAIERALERGKTQAAERDLASVILAAAGYELVDPSLRHKPVAWKQEKTRPTATGSSWPTPTLDRLGRDLTQAAREDKLSKVVGRADETELVIETLCRRTKRNPSLIGPAGVGKTAIAEGLAQKVVRGEVPDYLGNVRIIEIQPSALIAGTSSAGEFHERMERVIAEASQPGIILFVDEVHLIVREVADVLKPALARGELACITATTDGEYRRFIERDSALERRLQPIRIQEMSGEETSQILHVLKTELGVKFKVEVVDEAVEWLVDFGQRFMRNRHFPDKGVDLLEQCVAYAVAHDRTQVDLADAQTVARRMVGMPLDIQTRLTNLETSLTEQGILTEDEIRALVTRLHVTMRGLDLRPGRPNAVVLLSGEAAKSNERLAETIAHSLFGAADRVISIDLSAFLDRWSLSALIGSSPGFVGYGDSVPLHDLLQTPWSVVRLENIDRCSSGIGEVIAQALSEGALSDGQGRSLYFSDTVVLMTADLAIEKKPGGLGFLTHEEPAIEDLRRCLVGALQADLAAQVDLIVTGAKREQGLSETWLEKHLLARLQEMYRKRGLHLQWDQSTIEWLMVHQENYRTEQDWERWVDNWLSPAIIPYLPKPGEGEIRSATVKMKEDRILIAQSKEKPT